MKCHPTKTKYMIVGSDVYIRRQETELAREPIKIQGFVVGRSYEEKYLGMKFSAEGSRKTIEKQIEFRFKEGDRKLGEVKTLLETPSMREFGFLAGVKVLFESIVRSSTLYSAGVWVNMTRAMYEAADREDKRQLFTLLKINSKTSYYNVLWELDLLPHSYEIRRAKISLVSHMCNAKVSQAGKVAILESQAPWKPGLVQEARMICQDLGLPDPTETYISAECISEAIWDGARKAMFQKIATGSHNLRMTVNRSKPDYIYNENLSNLEQKLVFAWRLGILQFKTRYRRLFNNTKCIFNPCDGEDCLQHYVYSCRYLDLARPLDPQNTTEMRIFLVGLHSLRSDLGIPLVYI